MTPDINGEWINQNGSTIELVVQRDGAVSGWYCSAKGRAAFDKRYRVIGQQNGELITFQVDWQDAGTNLHAMTAFSGRIVGGGKEVHTVWTLARQFEDAQQSKPTAAWNAFLTNADVFKRLD
ncbi:MAG: avidin/streptavidin family protein [Pseudomonadota bacterium]